LTKKYPVKATLKRANTEIGKVKVLEEGSFDNSENEAIEYVVIESKINLIGSDEVVEQSLNNINESYFIEEHLERISRDVNRFSIAKDLLDNFDKYLDDVIDSIS
jgi:hypothetical protein